jgi:hypothetical protein
MWKRWYTQLPGNLYNIQNDDNVRATQLSQNVYNIENDVIHNCQEICITSKTMLYTIARKSV